jgi:D-glycero-D-manno-heptose 1,7-bisphosphate phosphatase
MRDWPDTLERRFERAVFLDRDGTINEDTHYPHKVAELSLLSGAAEGLRLLARLPVHIIVVSNQAGIAKGYYGVEEMHAFNSDLRRRVEEQQGRIDAFYYCPHLEQKDLGPGERACGCSKPGDGLLREAADEFAVDLTESFMIGDKASDIAAGRSAGCRTILVRTGKRGRDDPDRAATANAALPDLAAAASWIGQKISLLVS